MQRLSRTIAVALGLIGIFAAIPAVAAPADDLVDDYIMIVRQDNNDEWIVDPAYTREWVFLPNGISLTCRVNERGTEKRGTRGGTYSVAEGKLTLTSGGEAPLVYSCTLKNGLLLMQTTIDGKVQGFTLRRL